MHPYRSPAMTASSYQAEDVPEPFVGNLDVALPMLTVGALGIVARLVSPSCTMEASAGAAMIVLALRMLFDDVVARRRAASKRQDAR